MAKNSLYIETWGCQMNEHDSEKMAGLLKNDGYDITTDREIADVILLNTCSIREKAVHKVRSYIGTLKPLKDANPDLVIGVAGCVASQEGGRFLKDGYVDLVIGTQSLPELPALVRAVKNDREPRVDIEKHLDNHLFPFPAPLRTSRLKAKVTIMEGCNKFCTYCIVPFVRGRERSRPSQDIINEIQLLANSGYKEVELLGQTVNSYKCDINFPELLQKIAQIPNIEMIRYISPHPWDFTEELVKTIRDNPNIGTNLHMPLQSGSDIVLRKMRRGYTRSMFMEKVELFRKHLPEHTITTDIIVAFPGETEEHFMETYNMCKEIGFDQIYSFVYSSRPGTKAEKMEGMINKDEAFERLYRLQDMQKKIQEPRNKQFIGQTRNVLIDNALDDDKEAGEFPLSGRSKDGLMFHIINNSSLPSSDYFGKFLKILITDATSHSFRGKILL